eukprot:GFUD01026058.1.p1 GENE.GFUD01026058.1~~GFUD01026058.1.p1  ORF type:complete len:162 (+),score=46.87 GFUD01026058.1:74-559(+)
MLAVPDIIITSPILESGEKDFPSITVTRDMDDQDFNSSDLTLDSIIINNSDQGGLYPPSLYIAARSSNHRQQQNVEDFIQSRLTSIAPTSCRCTSIVKSVEESLECPVCRDRVGTEVYQCHRGHIMCQPCRSRLLTCPVCRSLLTLPAIRNRAMERLASIL